MKERIEKYEKLLARLFEKFQNASPKGRRKSLKMIDDFIAAESDPEIIEILETLKSELKKSV